MKYKKYLVGISKVFLALAVATFLMEMLCAGYHFFLIQKPLTVQGNRLVKNSDYGFDPVLESDSGSLGITKNGLRIFTFGASSTAGWPYGTKFSFTQYLGDKLKEMIPDKSFELMNFGIGGFDSLDVFYMMEESVRYSPDIMIVYTSHNIIEETSLKKAKIRFFHKVFGWFRRTYTGRVTNYFLNRILDKYPSDWNVLPNETHRRIFDRPILSEWEKGEIAVNYRNNLELMAALCRRNNIRLVVLEPLHNMEERGPVYSYYQLKLSAEEKEKYHALIRESVRLLKQNLPKEALTLLRACKKMDPDVAILNFYLAKTYARMGQMDLAEKHRALSTDQDGLWSVSPFKMRQISNRLKSEKNILKIPLTKLFKAVTGDTWPGANWFVDDIHPVPSGHRKIGHIIFDMLRNRGWILMDSSMPPQKHVEIDFKKIVSAQQYSIHCRKMAVYFFHLSFWTFDPEPLLKKARDYARKYEQLEPEKRSLENDVYAQAIVLELKQKPDIKGLTKKWSREQINEVLTGGANRYGHFNSLLTSLRGAERRSNP